VFSVISFAYDWAMMETGIIHSRLPLFLLLCLFAFPALAGEAGVMIRTDALHEDASAASATKGKVEKGTAVEIIDRHGGWTQIRQAGSTGWVRLLSVRRGEASSSGAGADLGGVLAIGTTRYDPNRVTATAGLRGLNEEELRAARFDPAQLKQLDTFASTAQEARQFAAAGGLSARSIGYLPAPGQSGEDSGKRKATNSGAGSGFNLFGGGN
jgi:hypothetical protein